MTCLYMMATLAFNELNLPRSLRDLHTIFDALQYDKKDRCLKFLPLGVHIGNFRTNGLTSKELDSRDDEI